MSEAREAWIHIKLYHLLALWPWPSTYCTIQSLHHPICKTGMIMYLFHMVVVWTRRDYICKTLSIMPDIWKGSIYFSSYYFIIIIIITLGNYPCLKISVIFHSTTSLEDPWGQNPISHTSLYPGTIFYTGYVLTNQLRPSFLWSNHSLCKDIYRWQCLSMKGHELCRVLMYKSDL